jgi:hypothetical protein
LRSVGKQGGFGGPTDNAFRSDKAVTEGSGWPLWSLRAQDAWPVLTRLALAGLCLAAGMALVGIPPMGLHGPLHMFGIMDPLCGGTRAVRLAGMGRWSESWRYNPAGVPLVVGAGLLLLRGSVGWVTGRWVTVTVKWTRQRRWAAFLVLALLALEINQQEHAALLH